MKPQGAPPAQMKVVCAWCGCDLGWIEANPHYADRTKQGICSTCRSTYDAATDAS